MNGMISDLFYHFSLKCGRFLSRL